MSGTRKMPTYGINATECTALLDSVDWTDLESLATLTMLLCIDVVVIAGNTMVIMAVYYTSKLRSVTNLFIVSLAVADLMVGIAVLPFSATWEVFKVWIFGDFLCSLWLAVDVWMCTASILNLCAISLDRYVAVTRPVTYPNIMSMRRAKMLVAGVWILSFVICLPPLIGWKDKKLVSPLDAFAANSSSNGNDTTPFNSQQSVSPPMTSCPWVCELTSDTGYVVYSAFGSFYIPMFVMLFFYFRIYRAAVLTTKAINQGFRTTKTGLSQTDETQLTLRIHRGRGSSVRNMPNSYSTTTLTTSTCNSVENSPSLRSPDTRLRRASTRRIDRTHEKVKISVSYPSSDCLNTLISTNPLGSGNNSNAAAVAVAANLNSGKETANTVATSTTGGAAETTTTAPTRSESISSSSRSNSGNLYVHYSCGENTTSTVFQPKEANYHLRVGGGRLSDTPPRRCSAGDTVIKSRHLSEQLPSAATPKELSPAASCDDSVNQKPKLIAKMGKRNIKAQVKRFRMETKAAKTLGIIVGGFICCWLPFFTLYLIRAFCVSCIHPVLFSFMFWLGYCNSAINPMIYALFSKDFRFAFQRIIYSCFSTKFTLRDSKNVRRGSDGSQLGVSRRADRSPSCNEFPMTTIVCSSSQHSESEPPSTEIK